MGRTWKWGEWESTVEGENRFASLEYSCSKKTSSNTPSNVITLRRWLLLSRKLQEFSKWLSNFTVTVETISRNLVRFYSLHINFAKFSFSHMVSHIRGIFQYLLSTFKCDFLFLSFFFVEPSPNNTFFVVLCFVLFFDLFVCWLFCLMLQFISSNINQWFIQYCVIPYYVYT